MTDPQRQTALRRIQKLKALAASEEANGNQHAAESAARIAAKLMVAHAIAQAEVDCPIDDDPMIRHRTRTGQQKVWRRTLFHAVARANNCTSSYTPGSDLVYFYGTHSDIEIAEYLAVYLASEVQRAADRHIRATRRRYGYTPSGERNSFCRSAVDALWHRLEAMRREAVEEAREEHGEATVGNALVVLKNKLARANDFANSFGLGKGRSTRYSHNSAGAAAGNSMNINKGLGGAAAKGITG